MVGKRCMHDSLVPVFLFSGEEEGERQSGQSSRQFAHAIAEAAEVIHSDMPGHTTDRSGSPRLTTSKLQLFAFCHRRTKSIVKSLLLQMQQPTLYLQNIYEP